jgi:drug/metabolite transporter (DMT)-like permease
MAYFLALCAGFFAALGAAYQDREVSAVDEEHSKGWRLIWASIKRPLWLLGLLIMVAAPVFQYLGLRVGNLTQVQPMLTCELLFLLGIIIVTHHDRPGAREWLGSAGIVVGLIVFLVAAHPHGGHKHLALHTAVVLSTASAAVVLAFYLLARLVSGWTKAALLGAAAATCFAYQAAMSQVIAGVSVTKIIVTPALYALGVGGLLGFVLFQHALRAGHVAASRAAMVIVDPLLSVVIGVVAFGDLLSSSPVHMAVEVVGLAVLTLGAQRLATSPMLDELHEASDVQPITP